MACSLLDQWPLQDHTSAEQTWAGDHNMATVSCASQQLSQPSASCVLGSQWCCLATSLSEAEWEDQEAELGAAVLILLCSVTFPTLWDLWLRLGRVGV